MERHRDAVVKCIKLVASRVGLSRAFRVPSLRESKF